MRVQDATWASIRYICLYTRHEYIREDMMCRGADRSLARPEGKQANVSVIMAWISFGALPCRKKKTWWQLASPCCWNNARPWHASELVFFLVGLRTYQHPGILVTPAIITLGIRYRLSGKPSVLAVLTHGKKPRYPRKKEAGWIWVFCPCPESIPGSPSP